MKKVILISLLLYYSSFLLLAQSTALRIEEVVLPLDMKLATVTCVYQDKSGLLWIGTFAGLLRYDGHSLKHYYHDRKNPYSIGDNKINAVLEDPKGNLWVGTQNGLNYLDIRTQRFERQGSILQFDLSRQLIWSIVYDSNQTLWVSTSNGVYFLKHNTGKFRQQHPRVAMSDNQITGAIASAADGIVFSNRDSIYIIGGKTATYALPNTWPDRYFIFHYDNSIPGQPLLWIGRLNGLSCLNLNTHEYSHIASWNFWALIRFFVLNGKIMINTPDGICQIDSENMSLKPPVKFWESGQLVSDFTPQIITNASREDVWFFSNKMGFFKSSDINLRFRPTSLDLTSFIVAEGQVNRLFELYEYEPDQLLIPTNEGPFLLNIKNGTKSPFPYKPNQRRDIWEKGPICYLEEGDLLWIGTTGGLFLFDKHHKRFVPLQQQHPSLDLLNPYSIRNIHRDRKNNLWVATWNDGIFKFPKNQVAFQQYFKSNSADYSFCNAARSILESRKGEIWVGTRGGLLRYVEKADSFTVFRNIPGDTTSMSENTAFCLYEDTEGNIWSGSYGGGLNCLDIKTGRFSNFTTHDGLLDNTAFSLLPDNNGGLWIGSFTGISRFDLTKKTFQTFNHHQGLLNDQYGAFMYGKSKDGQYLYFGGDKGVDCFNPENVTATVPFPPVHFTDFKLFNESVPINPEAVGKGDLLYLEEDIAFVKAITLRHDQNVLTFEYAAVELASPQTIKYAYKLVGFDTAWQYVGDKRSITFTNLNPKKYTLMVKSSNIDGVWPTDEQQPAMLDIIVLPPWWETWPFRLFVLAAVSGLITAFYRYRVNQIKTRESIKTELNKRIAQVKMEALRSQMNPHFVFNCLSSLKLFVEKGETEKASKHIGMFSDLLRRVLDDARADKEAIPLERELETLEKYIALEQVRFKDKFEVKIEVHPDVQLFLFQLPALCLQPYVENAILHGLQHKNGSDGLLVIKVEGDDSEVNISIEDNGIGREAAQAIKARSIGSNRSHGLNVSEERLALFGRQNQIGTSVHTEDLFDATGLPAGTRVTISLKYLP